MGSELLSCVIPLFNERESLEQLHRELDAVAREHAIRLEIVFVDDGSTDGSWDVVRDLAARDPRVRGVRFRRNFGKAAALNAGFRAAEGDIVVTLDADLQDDPQEVPNLKRAIEEGLDVVSGWKRVRHDPWHKVGPSRVFNALVSWLTGVRLHDHNCGLKAYRAEVVREVRLYGELHRFVPVLAQARGFRVGELVIRHRPREFGHSKYGAKRFVKGFLDLLTVKFLTGFSDRPLHFLGSIGLAALAVGFIGLAYLAGLWVVVKLGGGDPALHDRALLIYSVAALLFGSQLLSIGFIAELLAAQNARDGDSYAIAEEVPRRAESA